MKWLNDELDAANSLSDQYPTVPLARQADAVHNQTVAALRKMASSSAEHAVRLAAVESKVKLPNGDVKYKHADEWEDAEIMGVKHLVHTLDIVALGFPNPVVGADPAHATVTMNGQPVDLIAIRGKTHEACIEHSKTFLPLPRRQTLLVSRDEDNTPWQKKFGSYMEPTCPRLGQEHKITEPQGRALHISYEMLLHAFRTSPTQAAIQDAIYAELAA